MAKVEDKDEPKEWTPDQPMPDADDETEVQRKHQATRRLKWLEEQTNGKGGKGGKGGKSEKRSLF